MKRPSLARVGLAVACWILMPACGGSTGSNPHPTDGGDAARSDVAADLADASNAADLPMPADMGSGEGNSRDSGADAARDVDAASDGDASPEMSTAAEKAGMDAVGEGTADALRGTCPVVPALTEFQPIPPSTTTSSIDIGSQQAIFSSPGALGSDFIGLGPNTGGALGPTPTGSMVSLVRRVSPNGYNAVGFDNNNKGIFCAGGCLFLGTNGALPPAIFSPTDPTDVNDARMVVGEARVGGTTGPWHPFSWTAAAGIVDLGTLGGESGTAYAVSSSGKVTGESQTSAGTRHAFLWDGTMHDLGTLGGATSRGDAINAAGDVVGSADMPNGSRHAFLWHVGSMLDLGTLGADASTAVAINSSGQVVGNSGTSAGPGVRAFFWSAGVMYDLGALPGAPGSFVEGPHALNDAGQVVGSSLGPGGTLEHAFIWQFGAMRDLGTLGGPLSTGVAINANGRVVGNTTNAAGSARGFWVEPGACTPL